MKNFPKGSEIIMSAINIPDMIQIVKEHGLVAVPFDLDLDRMEPVGIEAFKPLVTAKVIILHTNFICNRPKQ